MVAHLQAWTNQAILAHSFYQATLRAEECQDFGSPFSY